MIILIVPIVAHHRWLLAWSTHPHTWGRHVYGRLVEWSGGQIITSTTISIATTYHDAFAPSVVYNQEQDEFLVAFTVNGVVSGASYSWAPFYQRVTFSGTLPGGESPTPLPHYGTHNWTDANSLEVVTDTGEYLLSYASVRDGGGFFTGPYDVRQFKLDSLGVPLDDGLVSDFTPYATDTEFDVSIGISNTILAVWGDLRAERGAPDVYGRRYGVGDDLLSPRAIKYYYHGGQRVAMRAEGVLYYLHGDHLGSTSLATSDGPNPTVVARQWYYPYGDTRYAIGDLPTDFTFTGQKAIPGTGLMFYWARYYHPALGRFVSADTIVPNLGNPQNLNRYAYVLENPLKYTDPGGHDLMIVGGMGGDFSIDLWKGWIMAYKGWTENDWQGFYQRWTEALGFDPLTQAAGEAGDNPANLAAASAVLESESIRMFMWGATTWNEAFRRASGEWQPNRAGAVKVTSYIGLLSEAMVGLRDITLIGWSKGANLIMHYLKRLDEGFNLVRPKHFVLNAPPAGWATSWVIEWRIGVVEDEGAIPASFGFHNVVHLCAHDDVYWGGRDIAGARNIHAGISGHTPQGQIAPFVYELLQVQFDYGAGFRPPQRRWPR